MLARALEKKKLNEEKWEDD
jgi:hypothetical protein